MRPAVSTKVSSVSWSRRLFTNFRSRYVCGLFVAKVLVNVDGHIQFVTLPPLSEPFDHSPYFYMKWCSTVRGCLLSLQGCRCTSRLSLQWSGVDICWRHFCAGLWSTSLFCSSTHRFCSTWSRRVWLNFFFMAPLSFGASGYSRSPVLVAESHDVVFKRFNDEVAEFISVALVFVFSSTAPPPPASTLSKVVAVVAVPSIIAPVTVSSVVAPSDVAPANVAPTDFVPANVAPALAPSDIALAVLSIALILPVSILSTFLSLP